MINTICKFKTLTQDSILPPSVLKKMYQTCVVLEQTKQSNRSVWYFGNIDTDIPIKADYKDVPVHSVLIVVRQKGFMDYDKIIKRAHARDIQLILVSKQPIQGLYYTDFIIPTSDHHIQLKVLEILSKFVK